MKNLAPLVARDKFNTRVQKFAEPRSLIAAYKTDKRLLLFQYIIPMVRRNREDSANQHHNYTFLQSKRVVRFNK